MNYKQSYEMWLESDVIDIITKEELKALNNEKEIEDRFYKNLEFGTGGLRGKIAAGTNRMNIYTVGKATQGLAKYLVTNFTNPSIAIAYDSRNMSDVFAETAAKVLAANGVKVYLYESLRPTPMLSFAVRHLGAEAGIVLTASHNPKEYNGYKVYGSDGGQLTDNAANEVLGYINEIDLFTGIKTMNTEDAVKAGLLVYIGEDVDNAYYEKVETVVVNKELVKERASELNIIYTPIHGSGNIPVRAMLKRLGYTNVHIVKEQELPDGNFPTAPYPNPENPQVFELAIEMAKEVGPDLIFGTDPDCDRIGVIVKEDSGEYKVLTGNQVGVLLSEYMLNARKETGVLSTKDTLIKTIVTTEMATRVAEAYDAQIMSVLTGFKYIGEKIEEFEQTGSNNFVLGFEESYGYLSGGFVRDKDAVIAATLIAEMALYYKTKGKNLAQALHDLFEKYGYYKEELVSITMEGKDGQEQIAAMITALRENTPTEVNGVKIATVEDYKLSTRTNVLEGTKEEIKLPKSNVLKFVLEDRSWFVIRPSGTEPKVKIYASVVGKDEVDAAEKSKAFVSNIKQILNVK
ncbi:phospho-sugar mutase [Cellulosilyticum lentocellum]|uniref:phosphoglucomutase (alpha-D-glucose-1,6-bisphosphate-dependent) n=1 Tax=Cellulosilyticum lentocellum (strain ATCC 49066 / DSM 5427 / NCIMB 11756 / RHM5) TaxID=642492 RepID=F2JM26_CELLD|nr:phospho-sugar mutase [Cellulosilyticum lentocellum]ADZ85806.1 phosphoglucomutase/phosphomannomutase alpha/beta/alpha domain I [Cellulosilyticum lentocellum DSM 5427]